MLHGGQWSPSGVREQCVCPALMGTLRDEVKEIAPWIANFNSRQFHAKEQSRIDRMRGLPRGRRASITRPRKRRVSGTRRLGQFEACCRSCERTLQGKVVPYAVMPELYTTMNSLGSQKTSQTRHAIQFYCMCDISRA